MPRSRVRLSAGRTALTREAQVLCFLAGADSIFYGDRLLTTANPEVDADRALLRDIGMRTVAPAPGEDVPAPGARDECPMPARRGDPPGTAVHDRARLAVAPSRSV
jgi:biotin synthase